MDPKTLQAEIFRSIKASAGNQTDWVEQLAILLNTSTDSCYRRIRGEKLLNLQELQAICLHYKLSLDNVLGLQGNRIMFTSNHAKPAEYDFFIYMKGLLQNMQYLNSQPERRMFYECKDIPIFYHFHSRELAAFKYFFWHKFLFRQKDHIHSVFSMDDYPVEFYDLGLQASTLYFTMPSTEFWNVETINSTLRQLMFYYDTGNFASQEDALMILQSIDNLIRDLEIMCRRGKKIVPGKPSTDESGGDFDVFLNEVLHGSNTILVQLGSTRIVYLNHSVFNYATTTDLSFGMHIEDYMKKLAYSSTEISRVSEMERNIFFKSQHEAIAHCRERIIK